MPGRAHPVLAFLVIAALLWAASLSPARAQGGEFVPVEPADRGPAQAQPAPTVRPPSNPDVARQIEQFDAMVPPDQEILPRDTTQYCVVRWPESEFHQLKCQFENRQALKRLTILFMEEASTPIVEAQFDVCRRRYWPDFRLIDYCISKELGLSLE